LFFASTAKKTNITQLVIILFQCLVTWRESRTAHPGAYMSATVLWMSWCVRAIQKINAVWAWAVDALFSINSSVLYAHQHAGDASNVPVGTCRRNCFQGQFQ